MLDQILLEILVDPEDKEPLWYFEGDELLYNPRLKRKFLIDDGIPVLLVSEAVPVDEAEHEALVARESEAVKTGEG